MNNKTISFVVAGIIIATFFVTFFSMKVGYNNSYTDFETQAAARQSVSKVTFDNTWKVISSQANVATKERESFKSTFIDIMNSRTGNDSNLMMKWSQEAQIPISADLYKTVQSSIESQRNKFTTAQKELIDIKREADALRLKFPGSMFLGGRNPIEVQLVTSDKTDKAFSTGKENEIDPFAK